MNIIVCEQRSKEWFQARCGVPSASNFDRIITSEGKQSKQRQKYMYQLAGEKLGGIVDESFQSFAMLQGVEKEAEARMLYEMLKEPAQEVGFCLSKDGYGCSPDGLVGKDGGLEIKCPLITTHIEYLVKYSDEVPIDYFPQVQGALLVTGRKWWDFMSYFPGLKPLIVREEPNKVFQNLLKKELNLFVGELNELVRKLS